MKKQRPSDLEKLITDYYRDNAYIQAQKRSWLTPKPPKQAIKPIKPTNTIQSKP